MKNLGKILVLLLIIITFCACTKNSDNQSDLYKRIKDKKEFLVGININSKPFCYTNLKTNEINGFDADLIREISKEIYNTDKIIKFIPVTPSTRILKLNSKKVDIVISTMTITKERSEVIDFSNPYFMTGQAILVKNNSNIRTGKDLNHKKVGIVLGTTAFTNIKYIAPHSNVVGFKNYKDAFVELQNGNIDAISTDDVLLQGLIFENNEYKILADRYSTYYYGIAFRKDEESVQLKNKVNDALTNLEASGKIKELEKKYDINYRR